MGGSLQRDRDTAIDHVIEFVDGYASTATRTAYRSDLTLWAGHCQRQARGLFEVRRGDIEGYARQPEPTGWPRRR